MDVVVPLRGLVAGMVATGLMAIPEAFAYRRGGLGLVMEWEENQAIAAKLSGRPVAKTLFQGLTLHFAFGGVAGAIFLMMFVYLGLSAIRGQMGYVFLALLFACLLFIVGLFIHRPLTGRRPGGSTVLLNLFSHIVYGLALGVLVVWP